MEALMRSSRTVQMVLISFGLAGATLAVSPSYGQTTCSCEDRVFEMNAAKSLVFWNGPQIGILVRDFEKSDVEKEGLEFHEGAVIDEIQHEGAGAKAGFEIGDAVIDFAGERVRSSRQLARLVQETPTGRTVNVIVMRDSIRKELHVRPKTRVHAPFRRVRRPFHGHRNQDFASPKPDVPRFELDLLTRSRLGIGVGQVGPQLADYFGVQNGVLVMHVVEDSAAEVAGLKAGDVITAVNELKINRVSEFRRKLLAFDRGDEVDLIVVRDKDELILKAILDVEDPEDFHNWKRSV